MARTQQLMLPMRHSKEPVARRHQSIPGQCAPGRFRGLFIKIVYCPQHATVKAHKPPLIGKPAACTGSHSPIFQSSLTFSCWAMCVGMLKQPNEKWCQQINIKCFVNKVVVVVVGYSNHCSTQCRPWMNILLLRQRGGHFAGAHPDCPVRGCKPPIPTFKGHSFNGEQIFAESTCIIKCTAM